MQNSSHALSLRHEALLSASGSPVAKASSSLPISQRTSTIGIVIGAGDGAAGARSSNNFEMACAFLHNNLNNTKVCIPNTNTENLPMPVSREGPTFLDLLIFIITYSLSDI